MFTPRAPVHEAVSSPIGWPFFREWIGSTGVSACDNASGNITGRDACATNWFTYAATASLAALPARLRALALRSFLRRRNDLGVASTYSSAARYSIERSRLILSGGASWTPLPSPWLRMLVRRL